MVRTDDEQTGMLFVAASGVCFAAQSATGKLAMQAGAPPFFLVAIRGTVMTLVAVASMLILRACRAHPLPVRHWLGVDWQQRRWLVLRGCFGSTSVCLSFASLHFLPISDANALTFTWPAFALVASWLLLRERTRVIEIVGLAGTFAGTILVARPTMLFGAREVALPPSAVPGVLFALIGACTTGITIVLIRKLVKSLHWTVVLIYQTIGQMLLAPIAMLCLGTPPVLTPTILAYGVATGALASVHQILLAKGLALTRVGPAGATQSTYVLASFGLQAVVTPADALEPISVAGALIIVAAVSVILGCKKPPAPAALATTATGTDAIAPAGSAADGDFDLELNDAALAAQKLEAAKKLACSEPPIEDHAPDDADLSRQQQAEAARAEVGGGVIGVSPSK